MRRLVLFSVFTMLLLTATGCSTFHNLTTGSENLEFQGVHFRVNAAHEAFIGSIGLKRVEAKNRYELKFTPKWDQLSVKNTTKFDMSLARVVEESLNVEGETQPIGGNKNVEVDARLMMSSDTKSSGKYHLLRIVDTKALVDQLNDDDNRELRKYIMRSSKYRIVTSIIIVYDQSTSKTLEQTANLTLELNTDSIGNASIEAKSDGRTVETLSMSDGTIYAYEFSRICWQKDISGHIAVADILLDRNVWRGDSGACIKGTASDPADLVQS